MAAENYTARNAPGRRGTTSFAQPLSWKRLIVLMAAAVTLRNCPTVWCFSPALVKHCGRNPFSFVRGKDRPPSLPKKPKTRSFPCFQMRNGDGGFRPRRRRPRRINPYSRRFGWGIQRILVATNILFFALQVRSAIAYLPALNGSLSRSGYVGDAFDAVDIVEGMVLGSSPLIVTGSSRPALGSGSRYRSYGQPLIVASSLGPFTMDFVHQTLLSRFQPHRLLTAGFLHGSLIHLMFNMRCLWTMPGWVEIGLGWPLYLSAYLVSVVTGNVAHSYAATTRSGVSSLCLGSSGGICGLNGLMFTMLVKMGNKGASEAVFKNMIWLVLFGVMTEGISNAAHVGGFLGGAAVGLLFGPTYGKSYSMMRKWSVEVDTAPRDYRKAMGFGMEPKHGMFPLWYLWAGAIMALLIRPELRVIPECIVRGFVSPGLLSGMNMTP